MRIEINLDDKTAKLIEKKATAEGRSRKLAQLQIENKELKDRINLLEETIKTNVRTINLNTEIIEANGLV